MSRALYRTIVAIEIGSILATVVLAVLWIWTGDSQFEPWLALTSAGSVVSELVRRFCGAKVAAVDLSPLEVAMRAARGESASLALERALDYARSVGDADLQQWLQLELCGWYRENGMQPEQFVPEYRTVVGQHYNEFMHPLLIQDPELQMVNSTRLRASIYDLEQMASSPQDMLYMQDANIIALLRDSLHVHVVQFGFPRRAVMAILGRIKLELQGKLAAAR